MFSTEIKETVYLAIGCFLVAIVLGLLAFIMDIRSDLAGAQNMQTATRQSMEAYTKYDKYNNKILYGEDVMEVIREFDDTDIIVYIAGLTDKADKTPFDNIGNLSDLYEESYTGGLFMDTKFRKDNKDFLSLDNLENGGITYQGHSLNGGVGRNATYYSYLIFGEYDETNIRESTPTEASSNWYYSEVTGVVIKKVDEGRKSYDDVVSNILKIKKSKE